MNQKLIISDYKNAITNLYGDRLYKIILYGSYARGDYNEESDIDFMVVLNDDDIRPFKEIDSITHVIYDYILQYGVDISSVPTTKNKYLNSALHFYEEVRREGIEI